MSVETSPLFSSLNEACKYECTIARFVIERLMSDGFEHQFAADRLSDCPNRPVIVGQCGTEKVKCSHPEAGNTDNFAAQTNNLYNYVRD